MCHLEAKWKSVFIRKPDKLKLPSSMKSRKMITQSTDTHPEIEKFLISLIRNSTIGKRISRVRSLTESTIQLSRRAIMRANPDMDKKEHNIRFISYHYGEKLAGLLREYMETRSL